MNGFFEWIRNFAATLSSIAVTVGILGQLLILISPRSGARVMAWWTKRKKIVEEEIERAKDHGESAPDTSPIPPKPSTAEQGTGYVGPTPTASKVTTSSHVASRIASELARRNPTYLTLWRSCVGLFAALILGGVLTKVAASDSFGALLGVTLIVVSLVVLYTLAAWALTTTMRLRNRRWAAGLAIGIVLAGPFMPLAFALRGPSLPPGTPLARFPGMFKLSVVCAAAILLGVICFFIYDGDNVLVELVGFLCLGWGYVSSLVLAVWAVRIAWRAQSVGWAISLVVLTVLGLYPLFVVPWLGTLLFTLNGPEAPAFASAYQPATIAPREQGQAPLAP